MHTGRGATQKEDDDLAALRLRADSTRSVEGLGSNREIGQQSRPQRGLIAIANFRPARQRRFDRVGLRRPCLLLVLKRDISSTGKHSRSEIAHKRPCTCMVRSMCRRGSNRSTMLDVVLLPRPRLSFANLLSCASRRTRRSSLPPRDVPSSLVSCGLVSLRSSLHAGLGFSLREKRGSGCWKLAVGAA